MGRARISLAIAWLALASAVFGATGLVERATEAFESGDLGEARSLFEALRAAEPENPAGWYGGGLSAEAAGNTEQALELLGRAAELDPAQAAIPVARGRVLARMGAFAPALEELARARALAPEVVDTYLVAALILRDSGRLAEAEALLRSGIDRATPRPELWDQLGLVLLSQGRPDDARLAAEQGLAKFPTSARLTLVQGLALATDPERREDAIASLSLALDTGLGGVPVHLELANLLLDAERVEEAIQHLDQAVSLSRSNPEAYFALAQGLRRAGRTEEADQALERFQALRTTLDESREQELRLSQLFTQALDHAREGRPAAALSALDSLLAERPQHARGLALRAKIKFSSGDVAAALDSARAARDADPSMTEHHYLVGLFSYHSAELDQAESALKKALLMDPHLGLAHEVMAIVALKQERPAEAIGHFERAIAAGIDSEELQRAYALAKEAAQSSSERDSS